MEGHDSSRAVWRYPQFFFLELCRLNVVVKTNALPQKTKATTKMKDVRGTDESVPFPTPYCRTTLSSFFKPLSNSVFAPLEMPTVTGSLRLPSLPLGSGTSTEAFLSLS